MRQSINNTNTNVSYNIIDNPVFKLKTLPLDNKLEEPSSNTKDSNAVKDNYKVGDVILTKDNVKGKIISIDNVEKSLVILNKHKEKIKVDFSYIKSKNKNTVISNTNLNFVTELKHLLNYNDFLESL